MWRLLFCGNSGRSTDFSEGWGSHEGFHFPCLKMYLASNMYYVLKICSNDERFPRSQTGSSLKDISFYYLLIYARNFVRKLTCAWRTLHYDYIRVGRVLPLQSLNSLIWNIILLHYVKLGPYYTALYVMYFPCLRQTDRERGVQF
jgi:hypothetical protein